jgi:hypothetical protein
MIRGYEGGDANLVRILPIVSVLGSNTELEDGLNEQREDLKLDSTRLRRCQQNFTASILDLFGSIHVRIKISFISWLNQSVRGKNNWLIRTSIFMSGFCCFSNGTYSALRGSEAIVFNPFLI